MRTPLTPLLKPSHIAGILVLLTVVAMRGPSEASGLVSDYAIALILIIVFFRTYSAWTAYQSIRNLEAVDTEERKYYLSFVQEPELRAAIDRGLATAQDPEPGLVEEFQPSPSLRRFLEWPFWLAVATSVALLMRGVTGTELGGPGWGLLAATATLALYVWLRLRTLHHKVQVSPFGIAEVYPNGSRRSLQWRAVAGVRHRRWLRVIEILPGAGPGAIRVSYDLTRGTRLVQVLMEHLRPPLGPDAS